MFNLEAFTFWWRLPNAKAYCINADYSKWNSLQCFIHVFFILYVKLPGFHFFHFERPNVDSLELPFLLNQQNKFCRFLETIRIPTNEQYTNEGKRCAASVVIQDKCCRSTNIWLFCVFSAPFTNPLTTCTVKKSQHFYLYADDRYAKWTFVYDIWTVAWITNNQMSYHN